ncbi:PREDICTED: growth-regulating factor 1-like isoform X2 [Lupinus angustifolius]|uniref:growth-regulating factor 1-like isoform X2 n=1 Tax=Lupinus angustifolius TaxID=3871 RepID=UPI00092F9940|nr:PREDICTED: growth-regulating factor 1-like isoform X2 [Lupinus angustifolius]
MDIGAVSLDGLGGSEFVSDPETKHNKWYGFGFLKHERSGTTTEDDLRSSKLAKTIDDMSLVSKAMLFKNNNNSLLRSNATLFSDGQQMLSFSSPKSDSLLVDKSSQNPTFPFSYHPLSTYNKNTGYSSESMHGILAGTRGLFTPSQWMELEHQALIYKYIIANVPVPSHLLIPIKKALDSAGFCNFSTGLLRPTALGWGGFHLGFSNNTDPEPGRCRRTDGKKWRCSRDAVVDQKYCERHMNRGRHRSRKPVEGQSGHALTGTTSTTNTTNSSITTTSKQMMMPDNNAVVPRSSASNNLAFTQQHEPKNIHTLASDTPAPNNINRMFMNKENGGEKIPNADALPMLPPTLELNPKENPFMMHKQQFQYEESSRNEFGFVTSDSLLNPSQKSSNLQTSSRSFGSSQNQTNQETDSQHFLRHFIDDWPKTQSNSSGLAWPELHMQSDRTELSISVPMTSTDFMSSTSSPSNEKVTLSPLRLSKELDPIQMGLGVGNALSESNNTREANWIPITWESSMGGPLGEVLNVSNNNNNNTSDHSANNNSSSALNLMNDGWDNSPPLGSSPTGVLQKTIFVSLSNSSAGSSPRAEKKTQEGATLCNHLIGSTLGN